MAMIGVYIPVRDCLLSNGRGGFEAIHFRHLDVHQNSVERAPFEELERPFAIFRHYHAVSLFFQYADGYQLICSVVLRQKDIESGAWLGQFRGWRPGGERLHRGTLAGDC